VTSSGNAVAEVGGGAALYANPLSVEDIAQKVLQLFEDKQVRKQQISQGLERVKNFSWIRAAEEIYQILVSSP
jgi:glycosyltransferase involved in cell wall biosynthesis